MDREKLFNEIKEIILATYSNSPEQNKIIAQHKLFEYIKAIPIEPPVKPERAKRSLYKVYLAYGYDFNKTFKFYVIASGLLEAEIIALKIFNGYDYGNCQLSSIEKIASEGQYSKPDILLFAE